jgi:hypothetical protein
MKKSAVQQELEARDRQIFAACIGVILIFMGAVKAFNSGVIVLALPLFFLGTGTGLWAYFTLSAIYRLRDRVIEFKENPLSLFVCSLSEQDSTVAAERAKALQIMQLAEVTHVRVYTLIYRDVMTQEHWLERSAAGDLVVKWKRTQRDGLVVNEDWRQFLTFVCDFKARMIKRDKIRLWQVNEGEDVERYILGQD